MYLGIDVGLKRVHMLWGVALCRNCRRMCSMGENSSDEQIENGFNVGEMAYGWAWWGEVSE